MTNVEIVVESILCFIVGIIFGVYVGKELEHGKKR